MRGAGTASTRTPDEVPAGAAAVGARTGSGPRIDMGPRIDVAYVDGESYTIGVRGHEVLVDQPVSQGGRDTAPTPTELFVASLASCVAFYAGRYLDRHGVPREGLRVAAEFDMAADRPARVAAVRLRVTAPPDLPDRRRPGLLAVVSHCTVHNSLHRPPEVGIEIA